MSYTRPYSLLRVGEYQANPNVQVHVKPSLWELGGFVKDGSPLVIDFETTGLDIIDPEFRVVGVALADARHPNGVYFSLKQARPVFVKALIKLLRQRKLIAHNVVYDASVLERMCRDLNLDTTLNQSWPWYSDTISMYFHLSQHEWPGQRYGLKDAQVDVLGWENRGDEELDAWLKEHGYSKGDMWKAPDHILGKYGALDAQSTWQLYTHLRPQLEEFPDTWSFITTEEVKYHYRSITEMRFWGVYVEKEKLEAYIKDKHADAQQIISFLQHDSPATAWIEDMSDRHAAEFMASEPPPYTKAGKVTVRHRKWQEKRDNYDRYHWLNFNSKQQLRDLFYNNFYSTEEVKPVLGFDGNQRENKKGLKLWKVMIHAETSFEHEWYATTTDIPISKDLLPKLGPVGRALYEYNAIIKLLGYMESMRDSLRGNVHHGSLRPLGTMTGRCAGNSYNLVNGLESRVNLQQLPKDRGYLECLTHRPGNVLIDSDVSALEPGVLAELSECPSYMELYGPGAKPNDIYLYVAAFTKALGARVKKYGYDPSNPTKSAISLTKKKAKGDRAIAKVFHLASGYGAGPGKIFKTLQSQGVEITFEEAKEMHEDYWTLFKRVKEYKEELVTERNLNGGWILDGFGNPVTIGKWKLVDILNTCIQGTGHRWLVKHIATIMKLRDDRQIDFKFTIPDFHDETTVECLATEVDNVMKLFKDAEVLTNERLGGKVYFKVEPEVCSSFADFKCE